MRRLKVFFICSRLLVLAKSYSYLLDIKKRSRSFQDVTMKYSALISRVLGNYTDAHGLFSIEDQEIGQLIVQYEETDWEFLKRILSNLETTITPAAQLPGIYVYIGIPELAERELSYEMLQIEKDFATYYYLKANQQQVFDLDYIKLKVKSTEILQIFMQVKIQQQLFMVKSYYYEASKSDFVTTYELQRKAGIKQKRQYPMHLIGVALKGTVANTRADMVQVRLDIDKENDGSALYWFPYSTVAASPDGSGWYCMPEVGDVVRVYFPSKETFQAIALSAVSDYEAGQGAADKMASPSVKYLSNWHNKEVILKPEYLQINCNGNASITISKDGGISLAAKKKVYFQAEESIHVSATSDITLNAGEWLVMQCGDGAAGSLNDAGQIIFKGTEVTID